MWKINRLFVCQLSFIICSLAILIFGSMQYIAQAQSDPPIHPDGWDLSFGEDGVLSSSCDVAWGGYTWYNSSTQSDNKILVECNINGTSELIRYTADGQLDTTFGTDGKIYDCRGRPTTQSGGSIICYNDSGLVRYSADGVLDNSFGDGNVIVFPTAIESNSEVFELFVQPDDKITLHGGKGIARFTPDGVLDLTLNNSGFVLYSDMLSGPNDSTIIEPADVLFARFNVDSDGRMYIGLHISWSNGAFDPDGRREIVVRLESDGSLDESFADSGVYVVSENGSGPYGPDIRQILLNQNDGTSLLNISGYSTGNLVRLLSDGTLDSDFNTMPITTRYYGRLFLDQNGYIIANNSGRLSYRLLPDGSLDASFSAAGLEGAIIGFQSDNSIIMSRDGSLSRNVRTKEYPEQLTSTPTPTSFATLSPPPTPTPFPTPTPTPLPQSQRSLALIYAVIDNDLGDDWTRLVNNIEAGAHSGVDVRLMVDGPAIGDANVYTIQPDQNPFCPTIDNPTCDDRYLSGYNYEPFFTEDTARPHALYQFLVDSLNAYPQAPQISLTILGHGSGWGANALPAQPSYWQDQNDTLGGMLWDDHTGVLSGSRSLSTLALGQAVQWATSETGRTINLVYLDGCSMGMVEVAYELRNHADYLLASSNTDWATFAYDQLLSQVDHTQDGRALGEAWLETEAALLNSRAGYPFTLALTDLRQVDALTSTVSTLADAIQTVLPAQKPAIQQAFEQSDRFDSNYDAKLDNADTYVDLYNFAAQLESVGITDTTVISAAQAVQTIVSSIVISEVHAGGSPWIAPEEVWAWQDLGGLSVYAPLHTDEDKRQIYYNGTNLSWARDTTWDELLDVFWADDVHAASKPASMPICHSTIEGCSGLANQLPVEMPESSYAYLPFMQ